MELRYTETNAADDSAGRAFGLDGNLYLPVVLTLLGALGLFAVLGLLLRLHLFVSGALAALPLAFMLAWAAFLKRGKPGGYDRDFLDNLMGLGDLTWVPADQEKAFQ